MNTLADELEKLADNDELLWNVARKAIEDSLVEWRDMRLSTPFRKNGLVIKEQDGKDSHIIRMGPEEAMALGLRALANHLRKQATNGIL